MPSQPRLTRSRPSSTPWRATAAIMARGYCAIALRIGLRANRTGSPSGSGPGIQGGPPAPIHEIRAPARPAHEHARGAVAQPRIQGGGDVHSPGACRRPRRRHPADGARDTVTRRCSSLIRDDQTPLPHALVDSPPGPNSEPAVVTKPHRAAVRSGDRPRRPPHSAAATSPGPRHRN